MSDFVFSPILSSNSHQGLYFFKVYYPDVVDLRVIKQEMIDILRRKSFVVDDKTGWHEE